MADIFVRPLAEADVRQAALWYEDSAKDSALNSSWSWTHYSVLEAHGLGDNVALRDDLYAVVLGLKKPWALVQWMGLAVLALAVAAFVIVRRNSSVEEFCTFTAFLERYVKNPASLYVLEDDN